MLTHRRWRLLLLIFAAATCAAPALAQQPAASDSAAPAAKKAPRHTQPAGPPPAPPPAPAPPAAGGAKPTLLGQYGDWGAYTASPGGKKVCFAIAKPATSVTNPPNRPRHPIFMFISTRPAEKVSDEVSVAIGYPFKPAS